MRLLLHPLVACLAMSGCLGAGPADVSDPDPAAADATALGPFLFADCRQFHTYYPARAQDFAASVPPGFEVVSDDRGLTSLRVEATDCARGPGSGRAGMLWVTVPVLPPPQWATQDAAHHWAVEAYVDHAGVLDALHLWGSHLAEPCACAAQAPGSQAGADGFLADGDEDDYRLQMVLVPSGGGFAGGNATVFVQAGDGVGRLSVHSQPSTSRGFGASTLSYLGPGGAPPVFVGEIGHVVDGLGFAIRLEPLGQVA